jgi:hypothetical protein
MNFNTSPDYQAQAEKCVEWAERATDRETELHWLSMARAYCSLAAAFEQKEPDDVWGGALPDMSHVNSITRH